MTGGRVDGMKFDLSATKIEQCSLGDREAGRRPVPLPCRVFSAATFVSRDEYLEHTSVS